jgi:hypothetical protein
MCNLTKPYNRTTGGFCVTPYASSSCSVNDRMLRYAQIVIIGYHIRACIVSISSYSRDSSNIMRWRVIWQNPKIGGFCVTPYASSSRLVNDRMLRYAQIVIIGYHIRACIVSISSYSRDSSNVMRWRVIWQNPKIGGFCVTPYASSSCSVNNIMLQYA